jgi:hypothetical protein
MRRLNDLLPELKTAGIEIVSRYEMRGRKGITLGDPNEYFPHPVKHTYQIDVTDDDNPVLTAKEENAIRRRFCEKGMKKK